MTLADLKALAQELGLTREFVSRHGDLRYKSTWQNAIAVFQSQAEPETEETVSDNLLEPLAEPEVINITPESYPETWELLQPPTEAQFERREITCKKPETVTYQVITEAPPVATHIFTPKPFLQRDKSEESIYKSLLPKLPFQDFFFALFSPPNHYQTSQ